MAASSPRTVHGEAMFAAEMEVDMNEQASSEVSSTVWGVGGGVGMMNFPGRVDFHRNQQEHLLGPVIPIAH